MATSTEIAIMIGFVLVGFTSFTVVFSSQGEISETGTYESLDNSSYSNSGAFQTLSLFDYLRGALTLETGLPIFDSIWKALIAVLLGVMVVFYLN